MLERKVQGLLQRVDDQLVGGGSASPENAANARLGCRTSDVALALLSQIVLLEKPDAASASSVSETEIDKLLATATAKLAELEPRNATEALLAVQMIGAQGAAMAFLARALHPEQCAEHIDRNVNRAVRLMRLFNEQVETMATLKGKSSQQRVVVEHVTVAAGGQALVGVVVPGGRVGPSGDDPR